LNALVYLAIVVRGSLRIEPPVLHGSSKFSLKKEKITIRRRKVHQD